MKLTTTSLLFACATLAAQTAQTTAENAARMAAGSTPIFRVTVVERSAKAINYRHRSGATKIDFQGTSLLQGSRGEAKVESKQGYIEIEVEFDALKPANKFGAEYLTYVLWAITPEGRSSNLGEILLNGTKSKLNVTTELQVFALVVTAEPYYAVTRPSDLVVMENVVRKDTLGKIEEMDAKYELLQRGQYERLANPLALKFDSKTPLELFEARNAVQIARAVGADRFSGDTFQKAEKSLAQAEAYQSRNAGRKPVTMMAREAVQTAEDARAIAIKRQESDALAAERQGSADRETRAETGRVAAESEKDRVTREAAAAKDAAQTEAERLTRERDAVAAVALVETDRVKRDSEAQATASRIEAERLKAESEARAASAKAESDRLQLESTEKLAAVQASANREKLDSEARANAAQSAADLLKAEGAAARTEADRLKAENDVRATAAKAESDRLQLESAAKIAAVESAAMRDKRESEARAASAQAAADRLKRENDAQATASRMALEGVAKERTRLETEKSELRSLLLKQFNAILQTRDTARGLIVNMSDVLFPTGQHSLQPLAREKMAKVAGIVSGHPGLRLAIEGHTDSVGEDAYNQRLSEQRGEAVRDYLIQQGMPSASITTKGLGETQPVASNDTAEGRKQNRRVELVISGEVIGSEIGTIAAR